MNRRDLLLGGACVAAFGVATALRPRTIVDLLEGEKLATLVPHKFGHWSSEDGGDIVVPKTPGSLADRLYSDNITRIYRNVRSGGPDIMLLIAYGRAQSDLLQLHRPESCYPAVGFAITRRLLTQIPLHAGASLPAVALTAQAGGRVEDIVYWTRLGEYLPLTAGQQRRDRLRTAMQGYVGDGALVRASIVRQAGATGESDDQAIKDFFQAMVDAIAPQNRRALVGSQIGSALGAELRASIKSAAN